MTTLPSTNTADGLPPILPENAMEGSMPNDSTGGVFINEVECLSRVPVSRRTWYSWRIAGKVPTIKVGRRVLYHWPSIEAALLRLQRGVV